MVVQRITRDRSRAAASMISRYVSQIYKLPLVTTAWYKQYLLLFTIMLICGVVTVFFILNKRDYV